jgi:hypothetical protein
MRACVHTSGRCKTVFRPAARSLRVPTAHVNRSTAARAAAKASIEFEDLLDVIKAVDESDVVEMALKGKKFAMSVKKQEALQAQEPVYVQAAAAPAAGESRSRVQLDPCDSSCSMPAAPSHTHTCDNHSSSGPTVLWPVISSVPSVLSLSVTMSDLLPSLLSCALH